MFNQPLASHQQQQNGQRGYMDIFAEHECYRAIMPLMLYMFLVSCDSVVVCKTIIICVPASSILILEMNAKAKWTERQSMSSTKRDRQKAYLLGAFIDNDMSNWCVSDNHGICFYFWPFTRVLLSHPKFDANLDGNFCQKIWMPLLNLKLNQVLHYYAQTQSTTLFQLFCNHIFAEDGGPVTFICKVSSTSLSLSVAQKIYPSWSSSLSSLPPPSSTQRKGKLIRGY